MFYKQLQNHLILNQKDRLNFNLGKIQAKVGEDLINFSSENKMNIVIQAIKFCDKFKKRKHRDQDDFINTAEIGRNTAAQLFSASLNDIINQNFVTSEFLGAFLLSLEGETEEDINLAFALTIKKKIFNSFKF